jgi:hypothetical protein
LAQDRFHWLVYVSMGMNSFWKNILQHGVSKVHCRTTFWECIRNGVPTSLVDVKEYEHGKTSGVIIPILKCLKMGHLDQAWSRVTRMDITVKIFLALAPRKPTQNVTLLSLPQTFCFRNLRVAAAHVMASNDVLFKLLS